MDVVTDSEAEKIHRKQIKLFSELNSGFLYSAFYLKKPSNALSVLDEEKKKVLR